MKWRSLEEQAPAQDTRTLREQLAERKALIAKYVPPETQAIHAEAVAELTQKRVADGTLRVGIKAPMFDLKDQDGKFLIRELAATAQNPGHGWVDYKWPNPVTKAIESKSSYVERMGNYFVGVGVYRN